MKFYDVAKRKHIEISDKNVKVRKTKNNKHQAYVSVDQKNLVRFISKDDYDRLKK